MGKRCAIGLMTRLPHEPSVKTRLASLLTAEQRILLQQCFLLDLACVINCCDLDVDLVVAYPPQKRSSAGVEADISDLRCLFGSRTEFCVQKGKGLGRRMENLALGLFDKGYEHVVIIGSDVPELTERDFEQAFKLMEQYDCVLKPVADGGFSLIGLSKPIKAAFSLPRYSHDRVLWETVGNLQRSGNRVALLLMGYDIDSPDDLAALNVRVHSKESTSCPATKAFLQELSDDCSLKLLEEIDSSAGSMGYNSDKNYATQSRDSLNPVAHSDSATSYFNQSTCADGLNPGSQRFSIIVPLYNEIAGVDDLIDRLSLLSLEAEIILVDGGSDDGTYEKLVEKLGREALVDESSIPISIDDVLNPSDGWQTGFRLMRSEKGRALQQNAGAIISRGDNLLFLHADSELPGSPLEEMNRVFEKSPVGCFGVKFDLINPLMITNRFFSNYRAKQGIMFGDQGIFLKRWLFFKLGMFPVLPLMEDYQFSKTIQSCGFQPQLTKHRIRTSTRRYPQDTKGTWRVMKQMFALREAYDNGADPEELARIYGDPR